MTTADRADSSLRTVVMIAYGYPPVAASGVVRTVSFAHRLPMFGWQPLVLTVTNAKDTDVGRGEHVPADIPVVRTPEFNLHGTVEFLQGVTSRLFRLVGADLRSKFFRDLFCVPDSQIAWLSSLPGAWIARRADAVYVSCSPFSSALSGSFIKLLTGRPLVVDFRDAWSLNPHNRAGSRQRTVIERMERFVLRTCDHLIVNTPGAMRVYHARYPEYAPKISVIPNGYDALNPVSPSDRPAGVFRIMHVGVFYRSREPKLLLEALEAFGHSDVEFVQVGPAHPALTRAGNRVRIRVIDQVPHDEALRLMRSASVLYLKQGFEEGVTNYIAVAAKTYEYLATGLPILAECPPGDNLDLVREYATHAYTVPAPDPAVMLEAVRSAYDERFVVRPRVNERFIAAFDRTELTRQLAAVLDRVSRRTVRNTGF